MFCERCQSFWRHALPDENHDGASPTDHVRWRRYEICLHDSMRELKQASESRCPICRAILFTPTQYERDALLSDDDEPLNIVLEIDAREGTHPTLTAAFLAPAKEGATPATRVPKRMIAAFGGILDDDDLASTLDTCTKLDNSSTGSPATLELASFWLRRCISSHERCRVMSSASTASFVPTRLLDVSNGAIKLIETATAIHKDSLERRFVALSHCWGKTTIIKTENSDPKTANYQSHLRNIAPADLSQTFRDAVHATRELGFRYLWIDSLCIIQDDGDDWAREAATMCDVYSNASLTLAAAHAAGGEVGCFEDRDGILQFPFVLDISTLRSNHLDASSRDRVLFTSYGRQKGLGGPEPPLYGRAWVLQEQLLSPRMLIFDGSQIRWECLCMHGSERSPQGGLAREHHKPIRSGIIDDVEFFDSVDFEDKDFSGRAQHQHWCYTVMDYTHRGMTKPFDRLVAIDGIAKALGRRTTSRYLSGLWESHIWIGILWSISHRNEYTSTTMDAFDIEGNEHIRHKNHIAPSWSWVSVTAPVVYPIPAIMNVHRISEIISTHVTGSPAKQFGRIEIRTHVRTGYIDSIYPYAIREAAASIPNMTTLKHTGGKDLFSYRGRLFSPNDFFIFSDKKPSKSFGGANVSSWRLVRGTWRPDQVIDPQTEITFIAIAQQNTGAKDGSLLNTHEEHDPLQTYTIGLVPSGNVEGEYTRVGYGVWEDCAWYGYMCGHKTRPGRDLEKTEGWRGILSGRISEKTYPDPQRDTHKHKFQPDSLPDIDTYEKATGIQERVLVVF